MGRHGEEGQGSSGIGGRVGALLGGRPGVIAILFRSATSYKTAQCRCLQHVMFQLSGHTQTVMGGPKPREMEASSLTRFSRPSSIAPTPHTRIAPEGCTHMVS